MRHLVFKRPRHPRGLGDRWGLSLRFGLWVFAHVRRFDVVHVHYVWSLGSVLGVLAGVVWRRPVVMTPHESLTTFGIDHSRSRARRLQKLLVRRFLLAGVTRVIVASELEAADSRLSERRCRVIAHPVSAGDATAPRSPRARTSAVTVGFLGRLHQKKRVGDVVDAVAGMDDGTRLIIAGDRPNPEFADLRGRIATEGLTHRVVLLGFVSPTERAAFLASIDVLAMPSEYECFGMAAAEALAAGVPVIVSDRTGIAGIVREHDAGRVVGVGVPADIRLAVREIVADDMTHSRFRENARMAAQNRLAPCAYAKAIREVYDQVTR